MKCYLPVDNMAVYGAWSLKYDRGNLRRVEIVSTDIEIGILNSLNSQFYIVWSKIIWDGQITALGKIYNNKQL